ncbi:unnamed protein product [Urochloa decumbens]|uniref:Peptidase A1 domain-containing protein n=1 Tax=Urochloa decumbens TaxID=240449 RepID=A0ABC9C189_9POAL
MAPSAFILLLVPVVLASLLATTGNASFDLHGELNHPYAGRPISKYKMIREAVRSSKARRAWNAARACRRGGGAISSPDVPVSSLGNSTYTISISVGTPPQRHTLLIDTGSDLVWIQCKTVGGAATATDPLYDPDKSSSFATVPCDGKLCQEGAFETRNCSNNRCLYTYAYGSGRTYGELASETFTFGVHRKFPVPLDFGCGKFLSGDIFNASGFLGLSPNTLSFVSQLKIPRIGSNFFYYLPLIGVSVGAKKLNVPATSFAETFIDSGYTTGALTAVARDALKGALVDALKLPQRNSSDPDYDFCFQLPHGVPMEAVRAPPLLYHFEGGATMVLPRDSYLVEASPGEMCLLIGVDEQPVIGNYQQQNMHVLFDLQNQKFSFVPTQCDQI